MRHIAPVASLAFSLALLMLAGTAAMRPAAAHAPLFDCFAEGTDKISCEGGFSDGSSASGIAVRVLDAQEKVLVEGKIDADGKFGFKRPAGDFHVTFDAGAGHKVTVFGADIQ